MRHDKNQHGRGWGRKAAPYSSDSVRNSNAVFQSSAASTSRAFAKRHAERDASESCTRCGATAAAAAPPALLAPPSTAAPLVSRASLTTCLISLKMTLPPVHRARFAHRHSMQPAQSHGVSEWLDGSKAACAHQPGAWRNRRRRPSGRPTGWRRALVAWSEVLPSRSTAPSHLWYFRHIVSSSGRIRWEVGPSHSET